MMTEMATHSTGVRARRRRIAVQPDRLSTAQILYDKRRKPAQSSGWFFPLLLCTVVLAGTAESGGGRQAEPPMKAQGADEIVFCHGVGRPVCRRFRRAPHDPERNA